MLIFFLPCLEWLWRLTIQRCRHEQIRVDGASRMGDRKVPPAAAWLLSRIGAKPAICDYGPGEK
jgi:hypothetical protein